MSSTTELIKDRLSIIDVVGAYIKLEKAGANMKARCPFHNEKTASFFISPARNTYYCFGCGEKGDIFTFVERFEGVDFPGALKVLADKAGVEIVRENVEAKSERDRLFSVTDDASLFFEENLMQNSAAIKYLTDRGLAAETIKKWRIGYAPDSWTDAMMHLEKKGYKRLELEKAGLIKPSEKRKGDFYDRFRARIMFPLFDPSGRIIAFSGRIFGKEDAAKYLNSPETQLFDKSRTLYGFHEAKLAIRQRTYSIMVEGQMDLIMAHQSGYPNAIATSGTAVTEMHLESLKKISPRLIIAYDADKAGIAASERAWQTALRTGMEIKICRLPKGQDPADLLKNDPKAFAEALKNSKHIIDMLLDDLLMEPPDHRVLGKKISQRVIPYVVALESPIEQEHYISLIASLASIPESALREEMNRIKQPQNAYQNKAAPQSTTVPSSFVEKSDPVIRKLFGLLFWYESGANKNKDVLREKIVSIVGDGDYTSMNTMFEGKKDEMLFEAEASFKDAAHVSEEEHELLTRLEEDHLKKEFTVIMKELQKAERDKDANKVVELLKKCQDISYKLRTIANQNIK